MPVDDIKKSEQSKERPVNVHAGHRERMKDRFIMSGLKGFAEHEILELLLMYAIPQKNVNPLAHDLLNQFGSISNLLRADINQLSKVTGLGKSSAVMIKLVGDMFDFVEVQRVNAEAVKSASLHRIADLCLKKLNGLSNEKMLVIALNDSGAILANEEITSYSGSSVVCSSSDVCKMAITTSARSIILAHNHPSGFARPSKADIETTEEVGTQLSLIGVELRDHIIVADGEVYSMIGNEVVTVKSKKAKGNVK